MLTTRRSQENGKGLLQRTSHRMVLRVLLFSMKQFNLYHQGIDHYYRYKEDIALFAEMGFKASFPVGWTRIFLKATKKHPMKRTTVL